MHINTGADRFSRNLLADLHRLPDGNLVNMTNTYRLLTTNTAKEVQAYNMIIVTDTVQKKKEE